MKRIYTLVAALLVPLSMYAGGTGVGLLNKTKDSDSMLGNGFFVNLGIGLPSMTQTEFTKKTQNMGVQPTLQLGNQWYFVRNSAENLGFGLNVSWLTFGASSYKVDATNQTLNAFDLYISPLRFGPMGTYAINEDMAIDGFFDLTPALHYGQIAAANNSSSDDPTHLILYGFTFTPGLKFRYKKLMVGAEYNFGNINATYKVDGQDDINTKVKFSSIRFLLGMKF